MIYFIFLYYYNSKILCNIFVYILESKMGKTEKTRKKITQIKWPKYQKPKDENMKGTKHKFEGFQKNGILDLHGVPFYAVVVFLTEPKKIFKSTLNVLRFLGLFF